MCVQNLVPIGPQATTCIPSEGYTHTQTDRQTETHTLSYIDIEPTFHHWLVTEPAEDTLECD